MSSHHKKKRAMKCTWHPFERGVGVCASCLRQRLLALTAPAQNWPSPEHHIGKPDSHHRFPSPPPLLPPFPRSASPYVPRAAAAAAGSRRSSSILSVFFGRHGSGDRGHWLPQFLRRRRKKKATSRMLSGDKYPAASAADRGMSPESCSGWWPERAGWQDEVEPPHPHRPGLSKAPLKRAATTKHQNKAVADFTGLGVCCSPLATACAPRQRPWMAEVGFSGEITRPVLRPHHRRHASTGGALLGPDRSGKLVDLIDFR